MRIFTALAFAVSMSFSWAESEPQPQPQTQTQTQTGRPIETSVADSVLLSRGITDLHRAKTNYMLNCQGCHGQFGTESRDGAVPALKDYVSNFLKVTDGRAFLVQVPGSANAAIDDEALAELLNWILQTQSPGQLPDDFQPFSTTEVASLRLTPEADVIGTRARLVEQIDRVLLNSGAE